MSPLENPTLHNLFKPSLLCLALFAAGLQSAAAANTAELPCRTAAECKAQAEKIGATVAPSKAKSGIDDQFTWVNRINKASIVMLTEEGIVTPAQGRQIAKGVRHVLTQAGQPDGKRPSDVLQIEKIMIDEIGPEASLIHSGRSRQDMYATYRLATLGTHLLDYAQALDAGQVSTYDIPIEAVDIAANSEVRAGALIGDIHTQYHQIRPWLLLEESATYTSSAMPQKRNPGLLIRTREAASDTIGLAHGVTLRAHNVSTGMTDYKFAFEDLDVYGSALRMLHNLDKVLDVLVVNPQRALEELENEWTTSMELADTLEREHHVPFRIGHSFASLIVGEARKEGYVPKTFPYERAQVLFTQAAEKYHWKDTQLPLDEARFRATLPPEAMVRSRVGIGGPQPKEVERMLGETRDALQRDRDWLGERRQHLSDAEKALDKAFDKLIDG